MDVTQGSEDAMQAGGVSTLGIALGAEGEGGGHALSGPMTVVDRTAREAGEDEISVNTAAVIVAKVGASNVGAFVEGEHRRAVEGQRDAAEAHAAWAIATKGDGETIHDVWGDAEPGCCAD